MTLVMIGQRLSQNSLKRRVPSQCLRIDMLFCTLSSKVPTVTGVRRCDGLRNRTLNIMQAQIASSIARHRSRRKVPTLSAQV